MNKNKYVIIHILIYSWIFKMIPLIIYTNPIFLDGTLFGLIGMTFGAFWDLCHRVESWHEFWMANKIFIILGSILTILATINTI
jgi:hypothetical protein